MSMRLSRRRRITLTVIAGGTWLSGLLWLMFHYFLARPGDFGVTPHPLEPWWLRLHGAFAFAAIWLLGLMSGVHIVRGWSGRRHRLSGAMLVVSFGWLIVTGYLLYYVGNDNARAVLSPAHWVFGVAAPLAYIAHRYGNRRRHAPLQHAGRRRRRAEQATRSPASPQGNGY
ncbi:MAG: hypothetical protein E6R07_09830 [Nevskiaceae bacterium]|nr:MAG: hypothetical protein E6R07_09830 [Nevskiaceae bacterium]